MTGTLNTEDATCGRIATTAQVVVLHINYRHTPEFPYPAAWDDTEDGFEWLHQNIELLNGVPEKVIIGGISSGAMLTAALVLQKQLGKAVTKYPAIAGQVLMVPYLVHIDAYEPQLKQLADPSLSSYKENEHAPLLPVRAVRMLTDLLKINNPDPFDLRISPGNASLEQVRGLPPTTFGIAGLDPFRDEGLLFSKLLSEAGVPTDTYLFEGVPHAFRRFGQLSQAKRWDAVMSHSIEWSLSQPKAEGFNIKTNGP
ncbi:Alpha/Beta hydrolase protein, partial [Aspergillus pseudodeflectus]